MNKTEDIGREFCKANKAMEDSEAAHTTRRLFMDVLLDIRALLVEQNRILCEDVDFSADL